MRVPLGYVSALLAAIGAVAPMRLSGDDTNLGEGWGEFVAVFAGASAVAVVLTLAYAHGALRNPWAVATIVLYVVLGMVAGTAAFLAPYGAAIALGAAMAAGDPLPPVPSDDERLHAPFVRRED